MSVELLKTLSLASYIIAGILAAASIALYFVLDVRKLIGEVSGSTERRAIENIRRQSEGGDGKSSMPSHSKHSRSRVTDKISASGRVVARKESTIPSVGTEKFLTEKLNPTIGNAALGEKASADETTVLATEETTVLTAEEQGFCLLVEMGFLGSTEIIE